VTCYPHFKPVSNRLTSDHSELRIKQQIEARHGTNNRHTGSGQSTAVPYTFTAVVRLMKPSITSAVTASGLRSRGSP
jgi:hypothetical protein